jgi:ATPase subunit of ABC transporter with duplicated ATPase domains
LLFVSHDRYLIEKFATRIWYLNGGTLTDFRGGYADFVAWRERQQLLQQNEKSRVKEHEREKKTPVERRPREKNTARALQKIEKDIARLESAIAALQAEAEANAADYQKLMEIEAHRAPLDEELLQLYEQWEELNE